MGMNYYKTNSIKIKKIFNILNQTNAIVANSNYTLSLVKQFGLKKPVLKENLSWNFRFSKNKRNKNK